MNHVGSIKALFLHCFIFLIASYAAHAQQGESRRLIRYGAGPQDQRWMTQQDIAEISRQMHMQGRCGGFMDVTNQPQRRTLVQPSTSLRLLTITTPSQEVIVNPLLQEVSVANITNTVTRLSQFESRYYESETGVQAAHWIRDEFTRYAQGRSDITVTLFEHNFQQPSVIARIAGQGPHATETVIIGAHEDSINQSFWSGNRAPGADDDASGVATVLEIFRILAQSDYRPDRSIEFITYAGEELGLLGSQDIARRYHAENKHIAGVMQFDMTMYPGSQHAISLITDNTNTALTHFTKVLIDTYVHHPWVETQCGYACSDHASWYQEGYATVFPFEAPSDQMNRYIHSSEDTLDKLDANFGSHFAKIGVAFAVEMAAAAPSMRIHRTPLTQL